MSFYVKLDTDIIDGLTALGNQMPKVIISALNDTARGMKTDGSKLTREEFNIKAKAVKDGTAIVKASRKHMAAGIRTRGRGTGIPLIHFGARPAKPINEGGRRPRKGVSVMVRRSDGRKVVDSSFIARWHSRSQPDMWLRKDQRRLPIIKQMGPSLPEMMEEAGVADEVLKLAGPRLIKNIGRRSRLALARLTNGK